MLHNRPRRLSTRRARRGFCNAMALSGFRGLGDLFLDVSETGLLLAADDTAEIGEPVLLTFFVPKPRPAVHISKQALRHAPLLPTDVLEDDDEDEQPNGIWFDAEATVSRIIHGRRSFDPGFALGLQFSDMDDASRQHLRSHLRGTPPPVPSQRIR